MSRSRLITIEGIDGVGKSTQCERVMALLAELRVVAATFREPGGTPLGESLRRLLQGGAATTALSELLLFASARAELVQVEVLPRLKRGQWVVLDRFTDSTLAYQGALNQIDENTLQSICDVATSGLKPDLTLWLDLPPGGAQQRRHVLSALEAAEVGGESIFEDAFELRDLDYFQRVRERYEMLYKAEPLRVVRIDASPPADEVAEAVAAVLRTKIAEWG